MAKNKFYFSHDGNARNDEKIVSLRIKHGNKGYGLFLMISEIILENKLKISDDSIIQILESEGETDIELIKSILYDFDLFKRKKDFIDFNFKSFKVKKSQFSDGRLSVVNYTEWSKLREYAFNRDNYTCAYCGVRGVKLELDHIVPYSKGGEDTIENLTTSCVKCNRQKQNKTVEEFLQWQDQQKKD